MSWCHLGVPELKIDWAYVLKIGCIKCHPTTVLVQLADWLMCVWGGGWRSINKAFFLELHTFCLPVPSIGRLKLGGWQAGQGDTGPAPFVDDCFYVQKGGAFITMLQNHLACFEPSSRHHCLFRCGVIYLFSLMQCYIRQESTMPMQTSSLEAKTTSSQALPKRRHRGQSSSTPVRKISSFPAVSSRALSLHQATWQMGIATGKVQHQQVSKHPHKVPARLPTEVVAIYLFACNMLSNS